MKKKTFQQRVVQGAAPNYLLIDLIMFSRILTLSRFSVSANDDGPRIKGRSH